MGLTPATHESYERRRRARNSAMRMARTIRAEFPDLRVTVDVESVDDEDAYVWIELPPDARPGEMPEYIGHVARLYSRRTGFWIVPRIVSAPTAATPGFRLRSRLGEARPLVY